MNTHGEFQTVLLIKLSFVENIVDHGRKNFLYFHKYWLLADKNCGAL